MILAHSVDCCFLNDTRTLKGDMSAHLSLLQSLLPDCRVIEFPTTRVATRSRTERNNRMGGGIAIVRRSWSGFIVSSSTYTDPMGLGLVNAINFSARDYKLCAINAYFPPLRGGTGPATLHSSITRYQQSTQRPAHVRRQTPNEFVRSLTQQLINQRRAKGFTVILAGDLNDPPTTISYQTFLAANQLSDPLTKSFGKDPTFHTRFSNSETQSTLTTYCTHNSLLS